MGDKWLTRGSDETPAVGRGEGGGAGGGDAVKAAYRTRDGVHGKYPAKIESASGGDDGP